MIQQNQYHMTYICDLSFRKATRVTRGDNEADTDE
jgi:hypothetical protein